MSENASDESKRVCGGNYEAFKHSRSNFMLMVANLEAPPPPHLTHHISTLIAVG